MNNILATFLITIFAFGNAEASQKHSMQEEFKSQTVGQKKSIETTAGKIAYWEAGPETATETVVFLHANSTSKEVFRHQLEGLSGKYRLIAIDLPGHGESDDALDPEKTYSFKGYASVVKELMDKLQVNQSVFVGVSLGGHVVYELMDQHKDLVKGALVSGSPPIPNTKEGFGLGFNPFEEAKMMGQQTQFTKEEAEKFTKAGGFPLEDVLVSAAKRTDGNARHFMIKAALEGKSVDARQLVQTSEIPLAIVIGKKDEGINGEYIKSLKYKNLVNGFCELDTEHATPMLDPERFNKCLEDFINSLSS